MADIKKELNDIKNAVYGREVRGSIHDGIKKINDEVENATDLSESAKHQVENIQQQVNQLVVEGDSSVEAAQARVDAEGKSYPTLKARLDAKETEFSSQLADEVQKIESEIDILQKNKAEKREVNIELAKKANDDEVRKKSEKIKPEDLSQETHEYITGGSVNLESIPQDESVTLKKTEKGIRDTLRPPSVCPPLYVLDGVSGFVDMDVDIYKQKRLAKGRYDNGKIIVENEGGTYFAFYFYVTNEMRKWGTISAGINMNSQSGKSYFAIIFYDQENNEILRVRENIQSNGLFSLEGIEIPADATHFGMIVSGNSETKAEFSTPILTYGEVLGSYSEDYFDSVFKGKDIVDNLISSNESFWRQGTIDLNADLDNAFTFSENVISMKKNEYIENKNYEFLYWDIPTEFKAAVVQFDKDGNQIENSRFINQSRYKIAINNETERIYFLMRYEDDSEIRPSHVVGKPIYFGPTPDKDHITKKVYGSLGRTLRDIGTSNELSVYRFEHPIMKPNNLYKYIAHGGYQEYAPDFSMEAYEIANLLGAWGVEIDIRMTKDNELVVIHDLTLDRTTNGTGYVHDKTLSEIKQLKLTQKESYYDYDLKVPTFDEVLLFCVKHNKVPVVEIKGSSPNKELLIQKMLDKLKHYNMINKAIVMSFNLNDLFRVREQNPYIYLSHIYRDKIDNEYLQTVKELGNFILFNYQDLVLDYEQVDLLRENNIPIIHGTADNETQLNYAFDLGIDAIMTNKYYDENRPTVRYNSIIETNDNGLSWSSTSINDKIDVIFDTTNNDLRFMFQQVPRNWLKQFNAKIEIEYLGIEDVIVKAFYDDNLKTIRCKFYENGEMKYIGEINNGKYNVNIIL